MVAIASTLPAPEEVSHNQVGQKLGRKGQETRERILGAMLRLVADQHGPPITLTSVAREAKVRLTNLYLYFPDMGELVLAALARVMSSDEASYLNRLRQHWPDEAVHRSCLAFLQAHYEFWKCNARLLHLRNYLADACDERVLHYRNCKTGPLVEALRGQMGGADEHDSFSNNDMALVLLTCLERVATVVTNPTFRMITEYAEDSDYHAHVTRLIEAEAELMALAIHHRRAQARAGQRPRDVA